MGYFVSHPVTKMTRLLSGAAGRPVSPDGRAADGPWTHHRRMRDASDLLDSRAARLETPRHRCHAFHSVSRRLRTSESAVSSASVCGSFFSAWGHVLFRLPFRVQFLRKLVHVPFQLIGSFEKIHLLHHIPVVTCLAYIVIS